MTTQPAGSLSGERDPHEILRIYLFGRMPRFEWRGQPFVPALPERALAVLAYVLLAKGPVGREHVASMVWPDLLESEARANLRRHLYVLQGQLPKGPAPWLTVTARTLSWNRAGSSWDDVTEFLHCSGSAESMERAVALYANDLLVGLEDEWSEAPRRELRKRQIANLESLSKRSRAGGDHVAALRYAGRLLEMEPWREGTLRTIMQLRYEQGDRSGALQAFNDFSASLKKELDAAPSDETVRLYERLCGSDDEAGMSRELSPTARPIPIPLSSFHGREGDIEELRSLLSRRRLITLVGPGGVGKTRLAIETALREDGEAWSGLAFVDLAAVGQGSDLARQLALDLGLPSGGGDDPWAVIAKAFERSRVLCIIDNCEHVIADAARVVERLLRSAPGVTVIATSREVLRVGGEFAYYVDPLPIAGMAGSAADDLLKAPAVQLFLDRATSRSGAPDLSRQPAALRQICERLDGLPLAIELAAARAYLGLEAIMTGSMLTFLQLGERTAAQRQQTLEATIAWSFDLLSAGEQLVMRRLAVFAGTFTAEAVEALVGDAPHVSAANSLERLVAQSLVSIVSRPPHQRYRVLETTRAYAASRLQGAGELELAERAHAAYYERLAREQGARFGEQRDDQWLASVLPDRDDFEAALARTLGAGRDWEIGLALAANLCELWVVAGLDASGIRWLELGLRNVSAEWEGSGRAWARLAGLYRRAFRFPEAIAAARRAIGLLRTRLDSDALCRALLVLGACLVSAHEGEDVAPSVVREGKTFVNEALQIAQAAGLHLRAADALLSLANIAEDSDDNAEAQSLLEAAHRAFTTLGNTTRQDAALVTIATTSYALGDFARAERLAKDILSRVDRRARSVQVGECLQILGQIALDRGDRAGACEAFRDALEVAIEAGIEPFIDARIRNVALLCAASGRDEEAARLMGYLAQCVQSGTLFRPPYRRRIDAALAEALAIRLGASDYDAMLLRGRQMLRDAAIALARDLCEAIRKSVNEIPLRQLGAAELGGK